MTLGYLVRIVMQNIVLVITGKMQSKYFAQPVSVNYQDLRRDKILHKQRIYQNLPMRIHLD